MKKIFAVLFATLILAFTAVPAFAAKDKNPSPSATSTYNVIVHPNKGGTGSYTTTTTSDGKYVILTAHNKDGYVFKYWIIDGKYVLIDGSLDSQKLKLKLNGDIDATIISKASPGAPHSAGCRQYINPKAHRGKNSLEAYSTSSRTTNALSTFRTCFVPFFLPPTSNVYAPISKSETFDEVTGKMQRV